MQTVLSDFKDYCTNPDIKSGKAASYERAISYLCNFLKINKINEESISKIRYSEQFLSDKNSQQYKDLLTELKLNGRSSYLTNGWIKAAIPHFLSFLNIRINNSHQQSDDIEKIILETLKNNQTYPIFDCDKCVGILPTIKAPSHKYDIRNISGTSKSSVNKIISGRKAEKYFLSFLNNKQFIENQDYYDVANNKTYGYDIKFFDLGIEIKNIKNGSFYLSDNEIAYIESDKTVLILVDIDNGIWVLKHSCVWLKNVINNIKQIREYGSNKYPNIELTDIKINIDNKLANDCYEISNLSHNEILKILLGT